MTETSLARRASAEALGTYLLVVVGCGAIMVNTLTGAVTHVGIALAFGLIIATMIATLGHISGAHFNPAVTFGLALSGHFRWHELPMYWVAQLLGGISGAVTLRLIFGAIADLGATLPSNHAIQAFFLEILMTMILMLVIMAVATDPRVNGRLAPLMIGSAVMLDALWGGPISGASMNPARSFGPALVAGAWQDHWIYWLGPLIGAGLGAITYQLIRGVMSNEQARPKA